MAINVQNPSTEIAGQYNTVAASQTDQVLSKVSGGATGATGDFLNALIIQVATAATAAVTVKDGTTAIFNFPNSPGNGVGVYVIPIDLFSATGSWKVTTGAGSTVLATGNFS